MKTTDTVTIPLQEFIDNYVAPVDDTEEERDEDDDNGDLG